MNNFNFKNRLHRTRVTLNTITTVRGRISYCVGHYCFFPALKPPHRVHDPREGGAGNGTERMQQNAVLLGGIGAKAKAVLKHFATPGRHFFFFLVGYQELKTVRISRLKWVFKGRH